MTMIQKPLSAVADRNIDFYRKQAKALLKAVRSGDRAANDRLRAVGGDVSEPALHMAQLAIAREQGFAGWPRFHAFLTESGLDFQALADRFIDAAMSDGRRARDILADHPDIAEAGVYAALVLGDWRKVAAATDTDPDWVTRKSGPQACEPIVYVCFSRFAHPRSDHHADLALTLRLLLNRGADADTAAETEDGPLSCLYAVAGRLGNADMTEILLDAGADPDDGESLCHATEHADLSCLKLLLDHGARITGTNALKHMLDREDGEGVRLLLDAGADPNEISPEGDTALHWAVRRGRSAEIIAQLLDHGADIDAFRSDGRTAYAMATITGQTETALLLARRGADTRLSALDVFIAGEDAEVPLESLNSPSNARLLIEMAEAGNIAAVTRLLDAGMPADVKGSLGETPLHWACWTGNADLIKVLIGHGAPLEERDSSYNATPAGWLHHGAGAADTGGDHARGARLLIHAGSSMDGCRGKSGNAGLDAVLEKNGLVS
ncbi:ankyrin repeat domain-containing protein [Asticcacaulis solisilvae]|uniref:ankyrin repeat domain-containing protein n=1 Tax=Asticcacaulis solisilvae TaxID=1217274 RepID=UPI003FD81AA8